MTNTQQPDLDEVSGAERPQEEVELTELLPVERTWMKDSEDDAGGSVADAFKALRGGPGVLSRFKRVPEAQRVDLAAEIGDDLSAATLGVVVPRRDPRERRGATTGRRRGASGTAAKRPAEENGASSRRSIAVELNERACSGEPEAFNETERRGEFPGRDAALGDGRCVVRQDRIETESASGLLIGDRVVADDPCSLENGNGGAYPQPQTVLIYFQNGPVEPNGQPVQAFFQGDMGDGAGRARKDACHQVTQKDIAEENLRRRIDAIIQANCFLDRDDSGAARRNDSDDNNGPGRPSLDAGASTTAEFQLKKYHCAICSARFKGSGGLRTHYKVVHGAGPVFACNDCGKEFPLKERLKLHVRTHTGYKPYKCQDCGKSFARGGQLVQHRRTHSQVKPYQCALCAGSFSCAANLALHLKRHTGQKDHKCDICGRAFVRRDALKKHLDCLHKDVKSFLCHICNKTLKGHLPQHMRTHAQDRPHGCATCGQRFAQKSQLTVHQRTHSGQRPFRCLVCWQAFAHSTALKLHTRRHTGERPFKCAECSAGFTQLPHWKKHMKCVHGRNEPYRCVRCGSFFRIKNDLESHEKTCRAENGPAVEDASTTPRYRLMTVERMRLLLAVLLKRISKPERLSELGFGKRLIDEVLRDSLVSAGKDLVQVDGVGESEALRRNLAVFLEWTVPSEHWKAFQKADKTPEEILETLTST